MDRSPSVSPYYKIGPCQRLNPEESCARHEMQVSIAYVCMRKGLHISSRQCSSFRHQSNRDGVCGHIREARVRWLEQPRQGAYQNRIGQEPFGGEFSGI